MIGIDESILEIRLEAFQNHIDSLVKRSDEGGYRFDTNDEFLRAVDGNFVFAREYLLPDDLEYHHLTRASLINIGKFLSDIIITPSAAISTTLDHFRYWGWTAAVAGHAFQDDTNEAITNLISDFQNTIHLGLLPLRGSVSSGNPTLDGVNADSERLSLLSGLSVLEGFICYIGDSLTPEGRTRQTIRATWKPNEKDGSTRTIGNGSRVNNYHDILQIWSHNDAGGEIASVLSDINDMTRYDEEMLRWKFEDTISLIEREKRDSTYNFLAILGEHRNLNLHGQNSTHALAPLVLTLCCLYIWDSIDDKEYSEISEGVIESIRWRNQTPVGSIHPLWPSAFYPV